LPRWPGRLRWPAGTPCPAASHRRWLWLAGEAGECVRARRRPSPSPQPLRISRTEGCIQHH
jgi:hypothetical protein